LAANEVKITRPKKSCSPGGITKGDLINYYRRIGCWMLPHLRGRPLAMQRYPDGIDQGGFFQNAPPVCYPDGMRDQLRDPSMIMKSLLSED
jgi:bifunctional non-homologous end joining protein LigD